MDTSTDPKANVDSHLQNCLNSTVIDLFHLRLSLPPHSSRQYVQSDQNLLFLEDWSLAKMFHFLSSTTDGDCVGILASYAALWTTADIAGSCSDFFAS